MDTAWLRRIVALAAVVGLLALGALEVLTARIQVDHVLSDVGSVGEGRSAPWPGVLDAQGDLADRERSLAVGDEPGSAPPQMWSADERSPG